MEKIWYQYLFYTIALRTMHSICNIIIAQFDLNLYRMFRIFFSLHWQSYILANEKYSFQFKSKLIRFLLLCRWSDCQMAQGWLHAPHSAVYKLARLGFWQITENCLLWHIWLHNCMLAFLCFLALESFSLVPCKHTNTI